MVFSPSLLLFLSTSAVTYSVTPQFDIILELLHNVPKNAERFLLSLAESQMVLPLTKALDVLFCL